MLKHTKWVCLTFMVFCTLHVIFHVLAYVSVNWGGYLALISVILLGYNLRVMEARGGYVTVANYCNICGILVWMFTWACNAMYWQYYYVAWVYACLVLAVALDRNSIISRLYNARILT